MCKPVLGIVLFVTIYTTVLVFAVESPREVSLTILYFSFFFHSFFDRIAENIELLSYPDICNFVSRFLIHKNRQGVLSALQLLPGENISYLQCSPQSRKPGPLCGWLDWHCRNYIENKALSPSGATRISQISALRYLRLVYRYKYK